MTKARLPDNLIAPGQGTDKMLHNGLPMKGLRRNDVAMENERWYSKAP